MTHLLSVHCDAYICYPTQFMMLCPLHEEIKSMRQKSWLIGNISPSGRLPKQRYVGCGNRRSLERSRIDAICIKQNDRTEKLFQLSLMIKIYEQTHLVCVWLREETEGSTIAIEKLKRMNTSSKIGFQMRKTEQIQAIYYSPHGTSSSYRVRLAISHCNETPLTELTSRGVRSRT